MGGDQFASDGAACSSSVAGIEIKDAGKPGASVSYLYVWGLVFGVIKKDERKRVGIQRHLKEVVDTSTTYTDREQRRSDAVQSALSRRLKLEQYPIHLCLSEMYVFGLALLCVG